MSEKLPTINHPEMVFGIAGPIGVDIDAIVASLEAALHRVAYATERVRITEEMENFEIAASRPSQASDFYTQSKYKMDRGNAICRDANDRAQLARIAIQAIRSRREYRKSSRQVLPSGSEKGVAYILRQLKRPDEVELFRQVYGRQFVLVSAHGPLDQRRELIQQELRRSLSTSESPAEIVARAEHLIEDDASEQADSKFGQKLRDTFHRADVFIDGLSRQSMDDKLDRFVQALFGRVDITPNREEHGMYLAKSASLRSADLSRQVGAAIVSEDGELIAEGCNEVPKAFGGNYWDSEEPDFRDVRIGYDPNALEIKEILRDLFQRLRDNGMLSSAADASASPAEVVDRLARGVLADAAVFDLTEYGRVVHAEMNAICTAARIGRTIKGATLYCTTFPCHNCTKHILAAGIRRVVFIEPYPKSRAKTLHANEIEVDRENPSRVVFAPFLGISPLSYREIFEKGRRKDENSRARRWYKGQPEDPRPLVNVIYPAYLEAEEYAILPLLGDARPIGTGEAAP